MIKRTALAIVLLALGLNACTAAGTARNEPAGSRMPRATPVSASAGPGAALNGPKKWYPGGLTAASVPGRAPAWQLTGTGHEGTTADLFSPPLPVQAGKRYVFSLWVDPSHVSAGSLVVGIYNLKRNVAYAQARIFPGPARRYAVAGSIPSGVDSVVVDFQPNSATVESGAKVTIAQPAFGLDAK